MSAIRLIILLSIQLCCFLEMTGKVMRLKTKVPPTTILALGDSITEGGGASFSYLSVLREMLQVRGCQVNFIGPKQQINSVGKISHAGYSGKTVEFLAAHIDSIYREYPADIVLIHSGHNHFAEEKPVKGMLNTYQSIIKKLKQINPGVTILMAQVINSGKLPKYSYIPELNKEIGLMVKKYNDPKLILVDQFSLFDWREHTIADHVHPNQKGAELMAKVWFDTLIKILSTVPWGVAAHPLWEKEWSNLDLAFTYANKAGIKWLREDFGFARIVKHKGTFDFAKYDELLDKAEKYHIQVHPILQAYDNELKSSGRGDVVPMYNHPEEWRLYVRETVKRYHHRLKTWEIWNEQDGGFWKPSPNAGQYVKLLKIAYEEIKAIDKNAVVVAGGLCNWNADYIQAMYHEGAQGYFDVLAVHPYNDGPDVSPKTNRKMKEFYEVMRKYESKKIPVWITEFGGSSFKGQLATRQPDFMVKAIEYALAKLRKPASIHEIKIGLAVSPRIHNAAELSFSRNWLPGVTLVPVPCDSIDKVDPKDIPVLIGGEGIYIDEPLLKPLHAYVQRGGLIIGHNKVPFHSIYYQDKYKTWQQEDRAEEIYMAWGMHFDAFWKRHNLPVSSNEVKINADAHVFGLPNVTDIYVDRYLSAKNAKPGDKYYPIIQSYYNDQHIGDGMGLYTYKNHNGGILLSTIRLENGYTEQEQANLLQRNYLIYMSLGIERLFWYDLHNDGPLKGESEHNFGLLSHDWKPKAAYYAYDEMTRVLGSSPRFKRKVHVKHDDVWCLIFERAEDKEEVLAVWSTAKSGKVSVIWAGGQKKNIDLNNSAVQFEKVTDCQDISFQR